MRLVVVIGVSHYYQLGPPACAEAEAEHFRSELSELISLHDVDVLIEELHEDFLEGRGESQCKYVAGKMNVDHLYCDFSQEQRHKLKILGPSDIKIMTLTGQIRQEDSAWELARSLNLRELYWVGQVLEQNQWPALLVVGSNHVKSVVEKFKSCGIDAKIACEYWVADK